MWYRKYNLQDMLNLGNITKRLLKADNHLVTHRWQEGIDSGEDIVGEMQWKNANDSDSVGANKMLCFNVLLVFARRQ